VRQRLAPCFALLATAPALGFPARGVAQAASFTTEAVVVTVGMTIVTLRDLAFGSVPKGVATTVAPAAATAGEWQITGNPNAFVTIVFTLPTQLTNSRANTNPAGATAFNPTLGTTGRLGPPANPTLYIWIGGTVNPAPTAKPGIYQGTIVLSLSYL